MKEIIGTARNIAIVFNDDTKRLTPVVEVIVLLSEPSYAIDSSGHLVRTREVVEQFRFGVSANSARALAAKLLSYAEEAEHVEDKLAEQVGVTKAEKEES